ncbi:MAG: radical SAM protein [Spirochaetaceae bacterium]|nr:MAG: radical SAM protein [Spirochaetaceae bacterium]
MSFKAPSLLFADETGNILDFPDLEMVGASAGRYLRPHPEEWIPMPPGSELFQLPDRLPVGYDPATASIRVLDRNPYTGSPDIRAVAAFVAPAYTQILSTAYQRLPVAALLPLFAYTAVGWLNEGFAVSALRVDEDPRQDSDRFDPADIEKNARRRMRAGKANRLIQHLGKCALGYSCPAAKNYFLERWEAPLPTSPACNARCLGCISLQQGSGICATQDRIRFVPTPAEIAEVAVPHLQYAPRAVVSFGQGCEGEPLLQADTIAQAIRMMRKATARGTINMNSNASFPDRVGFLREAGLDSMRVSLNSCRPAYYISYYKPKDYNLETVRSSIRVMKSLGGYVSLNYFIVPGFTDERAELEALSELIEQTGIDLIQMRNLNIDPEWYLERIGFQPDGEAVGISRLLEILEHRFPELRFGYFNPCLDPGA